MTSPQRALIHHAPAGIDEGLMHPDEARVVAANDLLGISHDWLDVSNYASAHYVLGNTTHAKLYAERALELERNAHTLLNMGVILETLGRFDEALVLAREANHLDPLDPFVGGLVADGLIRASRWTEGWPLYVKHHANWDWLRPAIREWEGPSESLRGQRILVLEGGGFGDNLIFLRYLPKLRALGAQITYMCPASLCPLVADNALVDRLIPTTNGFANLIPAEYDCFVSLLALGAKFGETVESIAMWNASYLRADPHKSAMHRKLSPLGHSPSIGICWKAGENVSPRKHRSLTQNQTYRLLSAPNDRDINWTSLVVDERPPRIPIYVHEPALRDWSDTAAVISNLDLVITVDTGVAHLAGALGKPTWVLLPALSSWPFLLRRNDSPLYPSIILFRSYSEGISDAVDSAVATLRGWTP